MDLQTSDKPFVVSSAAHAVAHSYWSACTNTFIANSEYYEACETVLKNDILPRLGAPRRAVDLGCGSGRFTLMLAAAVQTMDACDLSEALVEQARRNAQNQSIENVRFWVQDITFARLQPASYDLVSCMGVLSTIVDEWAFHRITQTLRSALRSGGFLLLRDSLSRLPEGQLIESETYATRYRNEDAYKREFTELGMVLEYETVLAEFGASVNRFLLYRAPAQRLSV